MSFAPRLWQLGVKSLLLHPLRSLLTVLGIFIGVSSVIWLLAIGEGISQKAQEQIAGLGAQNIIVRTVKPPNEVTAALRGALVYGITRQDVELLRDRKNFPTITRVVPMREIRQGFRFKTRSIQGRLVGCTADYAEMNQLRVRDGHFISAAEQANEENVCVLASGVAEKLFPIEDPIGRVIHVEDHYFKVVGVMHPRASSAGVGSSLSAQEFNRDVYVPLSALDVRLGDFIVRGGGGSFSFEIVQRSQLTIEVDHLDHVKDTADMVRGFLAKHHSWRDYEVVVPLDLLEQARTTRMLFMVFMGLMAAISLVVGGIGIMNIMLATVTERTREVGIRRALGAKRSDITRQFLVETIVLSVAGGATGILGGLTCAPLLRGLRWLLNTIIPDKMQQLPEVMQSVQPVLVGWSIPLAFCISMVIGVVFGMYPALRAANMDPVEALRHQ